MPWRINLRAFSEGGGPLFQYFPPRGRQHVLPFEYERLPDPDAVAAPIPVVECPRCGQRVPLLRTVCENCGFPFICDTTPLKRPAEAQRRRVSWRTLLGLGTLVFFLTNALTLSGSNSEYNGETTKVIGTLRQPADNAILI